MRPGKVALLVGVLLGGSAIETAYQVRERLGAGPFSWATFGGRHRGPSFTYETESQTPVTEGTRTSIANSFGDVQVRAGSPGVVDVKLRKVVYLHDDAKARAFADRLVVKAEIVDGALHVTTNRADLEREVESVGPFRVDSIAFETHLVVRVPPGTEVEVEDEHGDIDVAEAARATIDSAYGDLELHHVSRDAKVTLRHGNAKLSHVGGDLELDASYGDVELAEIAGAVRLVQAHGDVKTVRTGALTLETQYGDLEADEVGGDLEVRGAHSAVKARGIQGKADVESSYDDVDLGTVSGTARVKVEHGEVRLAGVRGAAEVETSYDDAILEDIGGAVTVNVEHGAVHASRIAAGARVKAQGDDVVVEGFKGGVEAEAQRGNVRLTPDGPFTGNVKAKSSYGNVDLDVPAGSAFELRAASDSADIEIDVAGFAASEKDDKRVVGRRGDGGVLLELEASHGSVRVNEK